MVNDLDVKLSAWAEISVNGDRAERAAARKTVAPTVVGDTIGVATWHLIAEADRVLQEREPSAVAKRH